MFGIKGRVSTFFVGIVAACFIGYCVYFDYKRCSAVDYKQKVHERRRKRANACIFQYDPNDLENMKRFFVLEIQNGETSIARGEIQKGIDHLINATIISGRPASMIQLYQNTLAPHIFQMLLQRMEEVQKKFSEEIEPTASAPDRKPLILLRHNE